MRSGDRTRSGTPCRRGRTSARSPGRSTGNGKTWRRSRRLCPFLVCPCGRCGRHSDCLLEKEIRSCGRLTALARARSPLAAVMLDPDPIQAFKMNVCPPGGALADRPPDREIDSIRTIEKNECKSKTADGQFGILDQRGREQDRPGLDLKCAGRLGVEVKDREIYEVIESTFAHMKPR